MDRFGRVVIPKAVRTRWGLRPGAELRLRDCSEGFVLQLVEEDSWLADEAGVLVFTGEFGDDSDNTLEQLRDERLLDLAGLSR